MFHKHYNSFVNGKKGQQLISNIYGRLSADDYLIHPELKQIVNYKKRARYDFLTKEETKPISTKNITDEKRFHFIHNLNAFRQNYYDYIKEETKELKEYNKVHKENDEFAEKYADIFKKKTKGNNEKGKEIISTSCLNDNIDAYEKMHYKIPQMSVEHNIFKENPLLLGEADLYKYYFFQKGNQQSENNSYDYLNKLNEQVFNKATAKKNQDKGPENIEDGEQEKYIKKLLQEIENHKLEILKTTQTLDNIDAFDDCFITKHNFNFKPESLKQNSSCPAIIHSNNKNEEKNKCLLFQEENRFLPLIPTSRKTSKTLLSIEKVKSKVQKNNTDMNKNKIQLSELEKAKVEQLNQDRSKSHTRSILEDIYEDIKHIGINNTPSLVLKDYFHSQRTYIPNDHTNKGMYRQLQSIKDKLFQKDYLALNLKLRGHKHKISSEEDLFRLKRNKKIENSLLLKEKSFLKLAFNNQK